MITGNKKGFSLVEALISITLLVIVLVGLFGSFFVAKYSAKHARHRMTAIDLISSQMEQEIAAGYDGGSSESGDYYVSTNSSFTDSDNVTYSLVKDPPYPDNINDSDGATLLYSGIPYKIVGFIVTWTEQGGRVCSERAYCYLSYHSGT